MLLGQHFAHRILQGAIVLHDLVNHS